MFLLICLSVRISLSCLVCQSVYYISRGLSLSCLVSVSVRPCLCLWSTAIKMALSPGHADWSPGTPPPHPLSSATSRVVSCLPDLVRDLPAAILSPARGSLHSHTCFIFPVLSFLFYLPWFSLPDLSFHFYPSTSWFLLCPLLSTTFVLSSRPSFIPQLT